MTETPASVAGPSDAGSQFVESPAVPESSEKDEEEKCDLCYWMPEQMRGIQNNAAFPNPFSSLNRKWSDSLRWSNAKLN